MHAGYYPEGYTPVDDDYITPEAVTQYLALSGREAALSPEVIAYRLTLWIRAGYSAAAAEVEGHSKGQIDACARTWRHVMTKRHWHRNWSEAVPLVRGGYHGRRNGNDAAAEPEASNTIQQLLRPTNGNSHADPAVIAAVTAAHKATVEALVGLAR